jgi:prepilin signal peptidase PulO-like enzyme (type II secretory pathway)
MQFQVLLLVFFLGLSVGSFVNVVISRTLKGESPYKGRSYCDHCKKQLAWFDNVPLVSFLMLRGKSRCCRKSIDWTYPLVELTTGLLFVWWGTLGFAFFQLSSFPLPYLQPLFWLLVGVVLVIIFFADLIYGIIPDYAVVILGGSTLLYRLYLVSSGSMQLNDLGWSVVTGVVAMLFFLGLFLGTKGRGLGFGDVKFALVMGFLLGFPRAIVGFFLSFLIGGGYGILLMAAGKKKFGQTVPFGPFLVLGLLVSLLWGSEIWFWYMGQLGM